MLSTGSDPRSRLFVAVGLGVLVVAFGFIVLLFTFFVLFSNTAVGPVRVVAAAAAVTSASVPLVSLYRAFKGRNGYAVPFAWAHFVVAALGGSLLRSTLNLFVGLVPALVLLSGAWLLAADDSDWLSQLAFGGAIAGALGLSLAIFQTPHNANAIGFITCLLLLAGLAVGGPVGFLLSGSVVTEPARSWSDPANALAILWALGPSVCALVFCVSHSRAWIRRFRQAGAGGA